MVLYQRFWNHPRNKWKARKACRKEKTIGGRLVRELERNLLPNSRYQSKIDLFKLSIVLLAIRCLSDNLTHFYTPINWLDI